MLDNRRKIAIAALAPVAGIALQKSNVFGPNPPTFFALGVLAAISIGGIILGLVTGMRDTNH